MSSSPATDLSSLLHKSGSSIPALLGVPKKRWRLILPGAGILLLAGALAYYAAVMLPARSSPSTTLQTAVVRRGDITLSASGTGTLQAAQQAELAFKATGKLASVSVRVGDQVTEGQVLAQLDDAAPQLKYAQAKENLESLTSATAIGNAQKALATATQTLKSAQNQLAYLISPDVYYWETEIAKDERAVQDAQAAASTSPSNATAQVDLKKARDLVGFAQDKLKQAQKAYHEYVLDTFTVSTQNPQTQQQETHIEYPAPQEILRTRQDITIAQGAVDDAQNLYAVLTGGRVPAGASGAGLVALEQAQLDLKTAQENLQATQLLAAFSGTVISVTAQVGPVSAVPTPVGSTAGTTAVRSTSILTIADMSRLFLKTYIDETDYAKFKTGNSANIVFDALPDQTFTGKVVQVDPSLDTSSGSAVASGLVELDPNSAHLLLGMTASVNVISAQARNAVLVPLSALHEYAPGKYSVVVLKDGQPTTQLVEIGLEDLVNAEVTSGLEPGDVVSVGPQATP
jgi:HlyD family secretion protein